AEVVGGPDPTLLPEERAAAGALARRILHGEPPAGREVRRVRRDRERLEVHITTAPVHDEAGAPQGGLAIVADLSDRRRLEVAEERARLVAGASALLDASLDYATTLGNLARFMVPALADYCLIDELEGDILCRVATAHRDPVREAWLLRSERHPLED